MGCAGYGPYLSRYVDEDLDGKELEDLLEHLTDCAACLKELKDLEHLQSWFQAADALDVVPGARQALSLDHLLRQGALEAEEEAGRIPMPAETLQGGKTDGKRGNRRQGSSGLKSLVHVLYPFSSQPVWRYAFAMIAVVALGVWLYPGQPGDRIDVRKLTPEQTFTAQHLPRKEALGHNMDLYVLQHASNQPWAHYGDELPMIRQVSGSIQ